MKRFVLFSVFIVFIMLSNVSYLASLDNAGQMVSQNDIARLEDFDPKKIDSSTRIVSKNGSDEYRFVTYAGSIGGSQQQFLIKYPKPGTNAVMGFVVSANQLKLLKKNTTSCNDEC